MVPMATKMKHTSSAIKKVPTVSTRAVVPGEPSWSMDERIMANIYFMDVIRKASWLSQNRSNDLCGRK